VEAGEKDKVVNPNASCSISTEGGSVTGGGGISREFEMANAAGY